MKKLNLNIKTLACASMLLYVGLCKSQNFNKIDTISCYLSLTDTTNGFYAKDLTTVINPQIIKGYVLRQQNLSFMSFKYGNIKQLKYYEPNRYSELYYLDGNKNKITNCIVWKCVY